MFQTVIASAEGKENNMQLNRDLSLFDGWMTCDDLLEKGVC